MQYGVGDVLLSSCHLVSAGARRLVRDVASAAASAKSAALSYTSASSAVLITISPRAYTAPYTLPPSYTVAAIISSTTATSCSASYQPKNVLVLYKIIQGFISKIIFQYFLRSIVRVIQNKDLSLCLISKLTEVSCTREAHPIMKKIIIIASLLVTVFVLQ